MSETLSIRLNAVSITRRMNFETIHIYRWQTQKQKVKYAYWCILFNFSSNEESYIDILSQNVYDVIVHSPL
jgi:hypothetical protein